MESELEEVSLIYHCLKNMGEVLDFSETLRIFSESLHEWQPYQKGILALVSSHADILSLGNIYEFDYSETTGRPQFEIKNSKYAPPARNLFEKIMSAQHPFLVSAGELFEQEGTLFPLHVHGEFVGFFAVEGEHGLPWVFKEKKGGALSVLMGEFALEIKKKMLYEKVKELSVTDSLCGVYLRRYFFQQTELELARAKQKKSSTALLMVDIDSFKKINDQFGHLAGDHMLKETAALLKENSREIDLVGRYGGDEFIVMLPNAGLHEAEIVKNRFLAAAKKQSFVFSGRKIKASFSVGAASVPEDGESIEKIIAAADQRLYAMKENKK